MKNLVMDELIGSLKVHKQELIEELQMPKGKVVGLKMFLRKPNQFNNLRH